VTLDQEAPVTPPQAPPAARRRDPTWLAVPLVVYAVSRFVQFVVITWMRPRSPGSAYSRLFAWDAGHFLRVARDGYPHGYTYNADGELVGNGLAFFPGYPLAIRVVHEVTRLAYPEAGLVASWLAGVAAAIAVYQLGTRLYDARVGTALTILFCTQPMSVVLGMVYSEGLFVALAAGTLVAAHRRAWLTAGALGVAAGLSRPTGAAVAVALAVAAAMALRSEPRRWRPVVAAAAALCAVPAYLAWVGLRVGNWHAWFDIQTAGWGSTFDWGLGALRFVGDALRGDDGWVSISVALILIAAVVSAAVAAASRTWPPLLVYGLVALFLVVGQGGYFHSKPRLLVPVLLVLLPPAVALGRARPRTAVVGLAAFAAFGLWYGAHMLTVWTFAI
jgi:Mannosyltransferase (PIG-V)